MDLSNIALNAAQFFIKGKISLAVSVTRPSSKNLNCYTITFLINDYHKATGIALDFNSALMKAISEIGEILLLNGTILSTEGVAGGILPSMAKRRSRNEYCERELVRWHLETETPFYNWEKIELGELSVSLGRLAISDDSSVGFVGYYKNGNVFNFSSVLGSDIASGRDHLIQTLYQANLSKSLLYEKEYLELLERFIRAYPDEEKIQSKIDLRLLKKNSQTTKLLSPLRFFHYYKTSRIE